jgi:hypothetical protein
MIPNAPLPIGILIDEVEQIRERLLSLQRSLEKLEPVEALVQSADAPGPE